MRVGNSNHATSRSDIVILDGDDTLWRTQELFERAKVAFTLLLQGHGISANGAIELLDNIDASRVEKKGFMTSRFTESMLLAYRKLCGLQNKEVDPSLERQIVKTGTSILQTPQLFEDTLWTLEVLSKHYLLVLATKGDAALQDRKINELRLRDWFQRIYNLPHKAEEEYRRILKDFSVPAGRVWVIGNSARSDINPALRVGLRSIWIPRGIWAYEDEPLVRGDVTTVRSLRDAAGVILSRDKISFDNYLTK